MTTRRYGMTIPLDGEPLAQQRDWIEALVAAGYTDLWSSEAGGTDGFTPLSLASVWAPTARLGSAIVPCFTRGPATLAMCVASMAEAAPGRFVFGVGSSSDVIVERWNSIPFDKPYQRTRDTVRFLKQALSGDKVTEEYETFSIRGFRLGRVPEVCPRILIAALRPGMLRLAGKEGDGAILNWLSADDVKQVAPIVHSGGPDKEIAARIFVCPTDDPAVARSVARSAIAAYLNVPVYAAFHEWLGRGDSLGEMWAAWQARDRKGSLGKIPDAVVDDLVVHGTPAECRAHIRRYVENGVDTPILALMPCGRNLRQASLELGPVTAD